MWARTPRRCACIVQIGNPDALQASASGAGEKLAGAQPHPLATRELRCKLLSQLLIFLEQRFRVLPELQRPARQFHDPAAARRRHQFVEQQLHGHLS